MPQYILLFTLIAVGIGIVITVRSPDWRNKTGATYTPPDEWELRRRDNETMLRKERRAFAERDYNERHGIVSPAES